MARKRPTTSDAVQILYRRYYEGRPELMKQLEEAQVNDSVARKLTNTWSSGCQRGNMLNLALHAAFRFP